jgi:hypothetical protein
MCVHTPQMLQERVMVHPLTLEHCPILQPDRQAVWVHLPLQAGNLQYHGQARLFQYPVPHKLGMPWFTPPALPPYLLQTDLFLPLALVLW